MEREAALTVLVACVCGLLASACGALPTPRGAAESERACWARIFAPLLPSGLALAFFVGWALQEPDPSDESLRFFMFPLAAAFAAIWARTGLRAIRAVFSVTGDVPAATVGLLNPWVVVSKRLVEALDPKALEAVHQHEAAHVRHRDPLRIWLAEIAVDLQWPWWVARARLHAWRRALEIARDDEARTRGVAGPDLAAAILVAARMSHPEEAGLITALNGDLSNLRERILRLLGPAPAAATPGADPAWSRVVLGVLALIVVALFLGMRYGEAIVRAAPGIVS